MPVLFRVVLLLLAALLVGCGLVGCGDDHALALQQWSFAGPSGETIPVTLPAHFDAHLPDATSHYALRTDVALDDTMRGRDLVLVIPKFLGRSTLLAGGLPVAAIEPRENVGYRARGPHAWRIPASASADGRLQLELDVDHTWTRSGWFDTVPRLTLEPDGGRAYVIQSTFNETTAILALCVAFAGYLYLVIFLTDRRRVNYGWFAVSGLAGALYPLFQTGAAASLLGPFETVMAGAGVLTATSAEIYFTAAHFGQPRPSRLWPPLALLTAIVIFGSVGYFRNTLIGGPAGLMFSGPAIVSQQVLLVRLARKRPQPANLWIVLGGWALLAACAMPDFAAWGGMGEMLGGTSLTCLGIFMIALLRTATISRAHTKALREADDLAAERKDRILQLELLNDELRRQVGARSGELASAITRLTKSADDTALMPGDIVDNRYEIVRPIGAGAGGSVYLVRRRIDGIELAMKVVRAASDHMLLARLAREAQLAAEVKHDNVISIVDVEVASSGFLYIVMEYVAGDSLRDHRGEYGNVPWGIEILAQVAAGLASVHAHGIVHRDLKPANILIVSRAGEAPLVKIADFGIAGIAGAEGGQATQSVRHGSSNDWDRQAENPLQLTETGVLLGTPLYMAPESVGGVKNAAPSLDIFSFGVIAFEVLRGVPPFDESPALAQLRGYSVKPAAPLGPLAPGVPAAVAALVDRCLSFEPTERPTAAEISVALRAVQA